MSERLAVLFVVLFVLATMSATIYGCITLLGPILGCIFSSVLLLTAIWLILGLE